MRSDQSVVEKSLRDHISKIEQQRRDSEEEISKIKALLVSERMKAEEELSQTRQKLKADQVCPYSTYHLNYNFCRGKCWVDYNMRQRVASLSTSSWVTRGIGIKYHPCESHWRTEFLSCVDIFQSFKNTTNVLLSNHKDQILLFRSPRRQGVQSC